VDRDGPREILTLLAAHGIMFREGGCGIDRLTAEDVAGALACGHLPRRAELVARAVILDDRSVIPELLRRTHMLAVDIAQHEGWLVRDGGDLQTQRGQPRLFALAVRALLEVVGDTRCRTCNGTGRQTATKVCAGCSGTGRGVPMVPCPECHGWRYVERSIEDEPGFPRGRTEHVRCGLCHGRGAVRLSDRRLAALVGVDQSAWSRRWAPRMLAIAHMLDQDLDRVERHCRVQVRPS